MSKQDRQGVRKPSDIERKYDLGQNDEILKVATNAQRAATNAQSVANSAQNTASQAATDVSAMNETVTDLSNRVGTLEQSGAGGGATFTPSVSEDGVLSWTNDKGLDNPAPVNIKGEKGDTGEQGEQGEQGLPASVNGISPDESGNILLTAAKIFMSDGTTTVEDAIQSGGSDSETQKVYTATGTVASKYKGYVYPVSISLPAGEYLVITSIEISVDNGSILMVNSITISGADESFTLGSPRIYGAGGGGVVNAAWMKCSAEATVQVCGYGYYNATYNQTGKIIAVRL